VLLDLLEATDKTLETVLHHLTMSRVQLIEALMAKEEEGGTGKSLLHELIHMMRYQTVKRVHEWTKKTEFWGEIVNKSIKWGEGEYQNDVAPPEEDEEDEEAKNEEGKNEDLLAIDAGKASEVAGSDDQYRAYFLALVNHNFDLCRILKPSNHVMSKREMQFVIQFVETPLNSLCHSTSLTTEEKKILKEFDDFVFTQRNDAVIADMKIDFRLVKKLVLFPDLKNLIIDIPESIKSGEMDP